MSGLAIDTFQIDFELQKLFSIYLKGFFILDYTLCCLADRRAAIYADMLLNILRRCVCRYRRFSNITFSPLPTHHPCMYGGFTMSIQQKPINEDIWSSKPPNTEVMTANIITYIFYCCLVHSYFSVWWAEIQYHHWASCDAKPSGTSLDSLHSEFCLIFSLKLLTPLKLLWNY